MRQFVYNFVLNIPAEPVEHGRDKQTGAQFLGDFFASPGAFNTPGFFDNPFRCEESLLIVSPKLARDRSETPFSIEERLAFTQRMAPLYIVRRRVGCEFGRHPLMGSAVFSTPEQVEGSAIVETMIPGNLRPFIAERQYDRNNLYEMRLIDPLPMPRTCDAVAVLQLSGWSADSLSEFRRM